MQAIKRDSSFASKVKKIVILGGAFFALGNVNPAAEANVFLIPLITYYDTARSFILNQVPKFDPILPFMSKLYDLIWAYADLRRVLGFRSTEILRQLM